MDVFIQELVVWFKDLSPFAKFFYSIVALAAIGFCAIFYLAIRSASTKVRRWVRRRRIPKNIDLRLDRDATTSPPKESGTKSRSMRADAPRKKKEYGKRLRKNMETMQNDAPFKSDD